MYAVVQKTGHWTHFVKKTPTILRGYCHESEVLSLSDAFP